LVRGERDRLGKAWRWKSQIHWCCILLRVITVPEAARRVGRNSETIRRWLRSGQLPSHKAGTQHLIEERDLDLLLKSESMPRPSWLRRTSTGEPMPDAIAFLRRQRSSHRS
jgi:excisionase family DNA binding protein